MSTSSIDSLKRPFPLTPPSQTEQILQQPKMSVQLPQTPQSPSQPGKASPNESQSTIANNTLPTPAHSINGSAPSRPFSMTSPESNKRKRDSEDSGDCEQKKVHVEDREMCIDDLHIDVGKKYLLCRTQHPKVQPDLSKDLFDMYNLKDIAATVARTLPNGEKNGLRKTYKGKIKDLNISGKFDVKAHENRDEGLLGMMSVPEQEWYMGHILNSPIQNGLSQQLLNLLPKAMTMAKGKIPNSAWDSSVLGDLEQKPEKKVEKKSAVAISKGTPALTTQKISSAVSTPQRSVSANDIARPKRKIKQRSYGDTSFEGYGEGYVDDEIVEGGYSTGEGEGSNKRRKKTSGQPTSIPQHRNSYGPGMVGS